MTAFSGGFAGPFKEKFLPFHSRHKEILSHEAWDTARAFQARYSLGREDERAWLSRPALLSLERLREAPSLPQGRYDIRIGEKAVIPCFYRKNAERADRLFVFFQGAVNERSECPAFPRVSWGPWLPGDCLHISDPLITPRGDLRLAWYLGYNDLDLYESIAAIVSAFMMKAGYARACSYGSSGGGFAALKLSEYTPISAMGLNPQIDCSKHQPFFDKYLKISGARPDAALLRRARLSPDGGSPFLIIQNILDEYHFAGHLLPFMKERGVYPKYGFSRHGNLAFMLYKGIQGHNAIESKELLRIILQIADLAFEGRISDAEADDTLIPLFELWSAADGLKARKRLDGLI